MRAIVIAMLVAIEMLYSAFYQAYLFQCKYLIIIIICEYVTEEFKISICPGYSLPHPPLAGFVNLPTEVSFPEDSAASVRCSWEDHATQPRGGET